MAQPVELGISPDKTYPLAVFMQLAAMKRHALAAAKKRGLRVVYVGKMGFVRGADFLEYLDACGSDQHVSVTGRNAAE